MVAAAVKRHNSVQEAAQCVIALLDTAGVDKAILVGHSLARSSPCKPLPTTPARVSQLVMVGTAYPMRVSLLCWKTQFKIHIKPSTW